jgi:preprotein translocase subunit YajC
MHIPDLFVASAWAQDAAATTTTTGGSLPGLVFSYAPLLLIVAVFYFLVIRPQNLQARQQALMLETLARGDVVETQGGLLGVVSFVAEKTVRLKAGDSELTLARSAVTRRLSAEEAKAAGLK